MSQMIEVKVPDIGEVANVRNLDFYEAHGDLLRA